MSNVTNLFDYKNDDPLILAYINDFLIKACGHWLDNKLYDSLHTSESLNMFISIRKLAPKSAQLMSAYNNFTMRLKEDNGIEFERLLKSMECSDLHDDVRWTPKQIWINGSNLRGYRIDFEREGKQRAFELIKLKIANNRSPDEDLIGNFRRF